MGINTLGLVIFFSCIGLLVVTMIIISEISRYKIKKRNRIEKESYPMFFSKFEEYKLINQLKYEISDKLSNLRDQIDRKIKDASYLVGGGERFYIIEDEIFNLKAQYESCLTLQEEHLKLYNSAKEYMKSLDRPSSYDNWFV